MLICTATFSQAASYSTVLPGLNGLYSYSDAPGTAPPVSFDFGIQFSSIQSLTIEVTASGENGIYQYRNMDGSITGPFINEPRIIFGFINEGSSTPWGGLGPVSGTVQSYSETSTDFTELDFLLDGEGEMHLDHDLMVSFPEVTIEILTPSMFEVENVTLTVNGTPVPVPLSLWLLGSGFIGLVGSRKYIN